MGDQGSIRGEYEAGGGNRVCAGGKCGVLVDTDSVEGAAVTPSDSIR